MLHTRSGLPRSLATWVSQVAASVGATLVASLIYAALPRPVPMDAAAPPELTSGGKFAARAVGPVAYDGLDAMPLPRMAPLAIPADTPAAETAGSPASLHRAAWDAPAPSVPGPERVARTGRSARAAPRPEPRHAAAAEPRAAAAAAAPGATASADRGDAVDGGDGVWPRVLPTLLPTLLPGILPALASGARDAWTRAASAGGSLVSRVVPQVP